MYNPRHFQMNEAAQVARLIAENPLCALVGPDDQGRSFVTHLPLTLIERPATQGGGWVLEGHMARANPHWRWLSSQDEVLAVFTGPDAYVSPRHYDTQLAVPTWNYLALHVYGRLTLVNSREEKDDLLKRLIVPHDPDYVAQWNGLPEDFKHKLLDAIQGFSIEVTRWEGKAKVSQNRATEERERIQEHVTSEMRLWMKRLEADSEL